MNSFHPLPLSTPFATPYGPKALFNHYAEETCMFASPGQTLLAHGVAAHLPLGSMDTLAARAADFLREAGQAGHTGLLMGAIPFLPDAAPHLFVPEHFELAGGGRSLLMGELSQNALTKVQAQSKPEGAHYEQNVREALAEIAAGNLQKVVLSRSLHVEALLDHSALLRTLASRNPLGYTYAIPLPPLPGESGRRSLIGASPELLLARRGNQVISNPLAGSIPRSSDPVEDKRRAEGLLRSGKDLHEHALVVDAVAAALRPYCTQLAVPARPSLVSTPTMWHLSSEVTGTLLDSRTTSLELALALHPTPAVCGYPTQAAREFIQRVEGFDRGYFTGLVGWCNAQGDGEWAVTIRCAEVGEHSATLYAGAGIVAGSDPALELAETAAKLSTMLNAMGLALADEVLS